MEGVTSASAAKQSKSAGLPNLTGYTGSTFSFGGTAFISANGGTGVFRSPYENGNFYSVRSTGDYGDTYNGGSTRIKFDASLSNSIYGKSTTVQPASYTVMYIMKIKA